MKTPQWVALAFLTVSISLAGQPKPLSFTKEFSSSHYEYSGLANLPGNRVLFILQRPESHHSSFYYADASDIEAAIKASELLPIELKQIPIKGLDQIKSQIPFYDGFEAGVGIGDELFLSIETTKDDPFCYIVKAKVTKNEIQLDTQHIKQLKKYTKNSGKELIHGNAGFESLGYLGNHKLIAFFEYNLSDQDKSNSAAQIFSTNLGDKKDKEISFKQVLPLRLTDIYVHDTITEPKRIIGINHSWNGSAEEVYRKGYPLIPISKDNSINVDMSNDCYTRIISITVDDKLVNWDWNGPCINPNSEDCENWEGILPFADGVLIVSDENNMDKKISHLYFIPDGGGYSFK